MPCRYLGPDYSDPEKRGVVGAITGEWPLSATGLWWNKALGGDCSAFGS